MMQTKFRYVLLFSILTSLSISKVTFAVHSSPENAKELRNKIEFKENLYPGFKEEKTHSVKLPVSKGFDQKETGMCWTYAFFNALESRYLVEHPEKKVELSRGAMQYINIKDRVELRIAGVEDHLDPDVYRGYLAEGGTATDAAYLVEHVGLLQFKDYHDIISPPNYTKLVNYIFSNDKSEEQKSRAEVALPKYFGYKFPDQTFFDGKLYNAKEFGKFMLGEGKWTSYAISKDGTEYIDKDPDPDARRGAMTHFIPREKILEKIETAIAHGYPVTYSNIQHLILLYGIEYDKNNKPVNFYMKDNYPNYFYKSSAESTLDNLGEITILEK